MLTFALYATAQKSLLSLFKEDSKPRGSGHLHQQIGRMIFAWKKKITKESCVRLFLDSKKQVPPHLPHF